jgi:hypothetical protein
LQSDVFVADDEIDRSLGVDGWGDFKGLELAAIKRNLYRFIFSTEFCKDGGFFSGNYANCVVIGNWCPIGIGTLNFQWDIYYVPSLAKLVKFYGYRCP